MIQCYYSNAQKVGFGMENVTQRDREILREVATRKAELAHSKRNDEILAMWQKQAQGVRDTPTVRLLFSNFTNEVLDPRMRCEGKDARRLERHLLSYMVGRELFDDDTPVSDTNDVRMFASVSPFGTRPKKTRAKDSIGFHIEPLTDTACRVGIRPKDDPLAAEVAIECDVRNVDIHGELLSDA